MSSFHPAETTSGTITSWIPMTTQLQSLPAAAVCSEAIYSAGRQAIAFAPVFSESISSLNCLPYEATSYYSQNVVTPVQGDFIQTSLGPFFCPYFYTTAYTSAKDTSSTFVGCCPSSYTFSLVVGPRGIGECNSPLASGQVLGYFTPSLVGSTTTWSSTSATISVSTTTALAIQINGWVFSEQTRSLASSSATLKTDSNTPSSPTQDAGSATKTSSKNTLSGGAIAGIVIGVVLIGLIAAMAAWWFCTRRWRKAVEKQRHELDLVPDEHELPAGNESHEMPASS